MTDPALATPSPAATQDTTRIDDTRIAAVRALVSPAVLLAGENWGQV